MSAEQKAARRAKFEGVFEKIRDELIEHIKGEGMPEEAVEWYKNVRFSHIFHVLRLIYALNLCRT